MRYHSETYPDGAVLRVFADESRKDGWRIQIQGREGGIIDVIISNDLEVELGTVVEE